ncbi:MAG: hypothetical protein BZ134_00315 [Methanosphaera sp. SHI1033]|nr:MAG: hypothetical protein BZ134_00315 [Methanosphaera sp. SHI1033]
MVNIALAIDNIHGSSKDTATLNTVKSVLESAGHTVTSYGVGPNKVQNAMLRNSADVMIQIGGGICLGTLVDFMAGIRKGYYHAKKGGFMYYDITRFDVPSWKAVRAHDDHFSSQASLQPYIGKTLDSIYQQNSDIMTYSYGTDATKMAQDWLTKFGGGSVSGGAEIVEGFIESGRGGNKKSSPQFWNQENYEPYKEIPFQNFKVVEEFPRTMTAEFETIENIDLTQGRVAVLITGDCNPFGGIIISKQYNSKEGNYTYKCQGFMERIMANSIYAVYNGGKDVYTVLQEVLADIGLPDTGLLKKKEYDTAITKENKKKLASDTKLTETSDMYDSDTSDTITDNTKNITGKDKLNPMTTKVKGIYDKPTVYDFIATLLFKYGVNIDFYGDINGIPHFDVQTLDSWKNDVWVFASKRGFENNYKYGFDITNAVTQVAVKNISATNGTGEIYTSKELLGVPLENYIGRMGIVVDNPTSSSGNGSSTNQSQNGEYQDSTSKKYTSTQIITTNGKPSCTKCKEINGGKKPTYKSYKKYWYNKCPSCEEEGELSSTNKGDGVTVCNECNTKYCQYCGYELKNHKLRLTELFKTSSNNSTNTTSEDDDND